jgi:hypothetical protein
VVYANAHGDYEVTLEAGAGPERVTCVLVSATLGGANGSATVPAVHFRTTSAATTPDAFRADVALQPTGAMTLEEGQRLIDQFVRLLRGEDALSNIMSTYVWDGPEALRAAVEDYQSLLGENITAEITASELRSIDQRVEAMLHGSNARPLSLAVYQDQQRPRRLVSPLIHYSLRSRLFLARFSRLVAEGDAPALARLLTADDVDYPLERAERVIAKVRPPFAAPSGSFELTGLDERTHTFTYRLSWRDGDRSSEAIVELGYGDGLLWLRDEWQR